MRLITLLAFSLFLFSGLAAQDVQQEATKMDEFASKTGVILRFEDHPLDNIKIAYGVAEAEIRAIQSQGETKYFFRISNEGKYGTKVASIAYEDVVEVKKALQALLQAVDEESKTASVYVENKFVTDDGFQVGYFVNDSKVTWYMKLEKFGSDTTVFLKDVMDVAAAFDAAIAKMEQLRAK